MMLLNVVRACRLVTPVMEKQGAGAILNISTYATFEPESFFPLSCAFRAGLAGAWGQPVLEIGLGGSIPFVAAFAETYPQAGILLTGVGEPTSHIHGPNESQDLDELRRGCLAEAIALEQLALQHVAP